MEVFDLSTTTLSSCAKVFRLRFFFWKVLIQVAFNVAKITYSVVTVHDFHAAWISNAKFHQVSLI